MPAAGATEGDKAPQIATIPAAQSLALAVTPVSAVLSLTHCVADRCEPVYERADAPVCQGRLSWPALCVPVASTLSPQDTLIVGHDLRPALRLAALDIAIGLSVLAAVMWVWRRARAGQSGAELVSAPRLKQVAETDALTGLLNRVAFEAALQRHNEGKTQTALDTDGCLMYFDLDRFKLINESLGHSSGDELLMVETGHFASLWAKMAGKLGLTRAALAAVNPRVVCAHLTAYGREGARAFAGVDSAPMHIAAAVGTPSVALFGPSSELAWGPWRTPHRVVVSGDFPCRPCGLDGCGGGKVSECLTTLPVERVHGAFTDLLAQTRAGA